MKIEWTKSGGSIVTLGDDANRHTILIDQWNGAAQVQNEALFRAANPFVAARGNVAGVFAFRATKSHASLDATSTFFYDEYARLGETGSLKITVGAVVITYTNAVLNAVARGNKEGVRLEILYTFTITTGTKA